MMWFKNSFVYTLILCFVHVLSAQSSSVPFVISSVEPFVELTEHWKFQIGDDLRWRLPEWDDQEWKPCYISQKWVKQGYNGIGIGWYRLNFKLPDSAQKTRLSIYVPSVISTIEIYLDGELIGAKGHPSTVAEDEVLFAAPNLFPIPCELLKKSSTHTLALRVSNHQHSSGAIYGIPAIGSESALQNRELRRFLVLGCFLGLIFTSFIYHLLIFFGRRKDWNYFYFACLTLSVLVYFICNNSITESFGYSNAIFRYKIRLEYLSVPFACAFNILFLTYHFELKRRRLVFSYFALSSVLIIPILITSPLFFTTLLPYIHLYLFLGILLGIKILYQCRNAPSAFPIILATLVFFVCVLIDVLMIYYSIYSLNAVRYGFAFCILALSISLAQKFNYANQLREKLQQVLLEQNRIFQLFVPKKYLSRITRGGGMDSIRVGNAEEAVVTILFSDIRGFTSFAEEQNPHEVFLFLNTYFNEMSICIEQHEGFIDKYIGDAIMAVFDVSSVEAPILAAIQMRQALLKFNQKRSHLPPIDIGVGLNTGKAMMGTVGSETRMDSTVIGDSVNLASRLEALTKVYSTPILISEFTYQKIIQKELFEIRLIDRVRVRGRNQTLDIFEVFNADAPEIREEKKAGMTQWEEALQLYFEQKWEAAYHAFSQYQKAFPRDETANVFIERCQKEMS